MARTALNIRMTPDALIYSLIAGIFSIVVMMMPVVKASRISIVELKQKRARKWKAPWWQKAFLDFLLLGIALYGLNDYIKQGFVRLTVEKAGIESPIDPLMFSILALFIFGAGLLFLRIYPLFIKLIHRIGKKAWPPVIYSSFIQVSRTSGREQFLMLFLVLTMSVGIFSANSARTINQNIEDRVNYSVGSDMNLKTVWKSNEVTDTGMSGPPATTSYSQEPVIYIEPPFSLMGQIEDTLAAAKVFRTDGASIRIGSETKKGQIMAINPYDFGKVVWKSESLLPHHINEYLNLMDYSPQSVIVSEAFRQEYGLEQGDTVSYSWSGQAYLEGVIVAFSEFWPGINPL